MAASTARTSTFNGQPYTGNLKSIEATSPKTVVFTFCNPNVAFLPQIAFASLAIDDAQYLIDTCRPMAILLNQPNGTGPYKFVVLGPRLAHRPRRRTTPTGAPRR